MTTATATPNAPMGWFARAEAWLDARGKGAWIAAMVLGFILFWPVGLAILAYMLWSRRLFAGASCRGGRTARAMVGGTSGNTAFDAYRDETLRRLEEEQKAFQDFLERLRAAKDKAEFDQFMEERARAHASDDRKGGDEDGRAEEDPRRGPDPA